MPPRDRYLMEVKVTGVPQVEARLVELGKVKVPAAIRRGLAVGGQMMSKAIKGQETSSIAGHGKGPVRLQDSIGYRTGGKMSDEWVLAGPLREKKGFHRHLVIDGHEIVVKHHGGGFYVGTARRDRQGNATARFNFAGHELRQGQTHGRTRANPFVWRAKESTAAPALAAVEVSLAKVLAQAGKP
jgi:hypothetical protein